MEAHLEDCAECRREAAELEGVVRLLRGASLATSQPAVPSPRPASGLEDRIIERVRAASAVEGRPSAAPAGQSAPIPLSRPRRSTGRTLLALAAAFTFFAVGLGVGWAVFRAPAGPPMEAIAFSVTPPGITADGDLIAHTWGTEADLVIIGLEQDERYVVTFVALDGREVDGGTFIGIPGRLVCKLNAAVLRPSVTRLLIRDSDGSEILSADLAS